MCAHIYVYTNIYLYMHIYIYIYLFIYLYLYLEMIYAIWPFGPLTEATQSDRLSSSVNKQPMEFYECSGPALARLPLKGAFKGNIALYRGYMLWAMAVFWALSSYKPLEPRVWGSSKGKYRVPLKGLWVTYGRFRVVVMIL